MMTHLHTHSIAHPLTHSLACSLARKRARMLVCSCVDARVSATHASTSVPLHVLVRYRCLELVEVVHEDAAPGLVAWARHRTSRAGVAREFRPVFDARPSPARRAGATARNSNHDYMHKGLASFSINASWSQTTNSGCAEVVFSSGEAHEAGPTIILRSPSAHGKSRRAGQSEDRSAPDSASGRGAARSCGLRGRGRRLGGPSAGSASGGGRREWGGARAGRPPLARPPLAPIREALMGGVCLFGGLLELQRSEADRRHGLSLRRCRSRAWH